MRTVCGLVFGMWLCMPVDGRAQARFADVALESGDRAHVILASGEKITGRVDFVAAGEIGVDGRRVTPDSVQRVERIGDRAWDVAAAAFAVGAVVGQDAQLGCDGSGVSRRVGCALLPGLLFGSLGFLLDRAHEGRTTVFSRGESVAVTPFMLGSGGGVVVRLRLGPAH